MTFAAAAAKAIFLSTQYSSSEIYQQSPTTRTCRRDAGETDIAELAGFFAAFTK
jgi:hypothetical protein